MKCAENYPQEGLHRAFALINVQILLTGETDTPDVRSVCIQSKSNNVPQQYLRRLQATTYSILTATLRLRDISSSLSSALKLKKSPAKTTPSHPKAHRAHPATHETSTSEFSDRSLFAYAKDSLVSPKFPRVRQEGGWCRGGSRGVGGFP